MNNFIYLSELSPQQVKEYRQGVSEAFPKLTLMSPTSLKYFPRVESYFPQFQYYLISDRAEVIGFMNTVPFHFSGPISELSDNGWDWMLAKGITDYEQNIEPNYLGGLQIIIRKEFQSQGFSKKIISYAKQVIKNSRFNNLVIPIRPTKKFEYPSMSMDDYMSLKSENKIFDPWIRTHIKSGAEVIKVCNNAMNIKGDIPFWESILETSIITSGKYLPYGALNFAVINVENNVGEYREPNIWIKYD